MLMSEEDDEEKHIICILMSEEDEEEKTIIIGENWNYWGKINGTTQEMEWAVPAIIAVLPEREPVNAFPAAKPMSAASPSGDTFSLPSLDRRGCDESGVRATAWKSCG